VVTGDFFQLPPVNKGNTAVKFAFEAATWMQTIKRTIKLTKVFRQKDQGVWLILLTVTTVVKIYPRICRNAERNALWYTVSDIHFQVQGSIPGDRI